MSRLNDQDVLQFASCTQCESYRYTPPRLYPVDNAYPGEHECRNGDFGQDKPCDEILGAVERLIEGGVLDSREGYMVASADIEDVEKEAFPDVPWEIHPYWWIWNDGREPTHFDTLAEVWENLFL